MVFAILSALAGFGAIYTNKDRNDYPHFLTYHSYFGIAGILAGLSAAMGLSTLFFCILKKKNFLSFKREFCHNFFLNTDILSEIRRSWSLL